MNKTAAQEWLKKAWHNLSGAQLFFDANHYSDTTAVEIHYALEKSLKAILAYQNQKIPKSHDLGEIHSLIVERISFDESEMDMLDIISEYHIEEAYPAFDRELPSQQEIKEVLAFAQKVFDRVCGILDVDKELLK
ncbi:MAG: HEPN domain-containing protein [Campylobacterales bacterium]|nr:HEPN domain-containing protein [Campylobacterales bacterium]